jgi:hypothetical protein
MVALLTADDPALFLLFPPQWGIFSQDGGPILTVDSVASVEYTRDYRISDFPQEQGAFASYNKVQQPFRAKLVFLIEQSRIAFLQSVEAAVASLDFVTVVTPEIQYPSANLTSYSYRREASNGKTLIRVEVQCEQVRVINAASLGSSVSASDAAVPNSQISDTSGGSNSSSTASGFPNAQSTNAASPTQSGQVQAIDPGSSNSNGTPLFLTRYAGVEPPT